MHDCPAPDCNVAVPKHQIFCRRHWFMVPGELRTRIWRSWGNRQSWSIAEADNHRGLVMEAVTFVSRKVRNG